MKFLTSPYMMAVATIIYMVVGTVRDAYFPTDDAPVVSTPLPSDMGPFLAGPPNAKAIPTTFLTTFIANPRSAAERLATPRTDCESAPPAAVLAQRQPVKDTVAFAVQESRPAPKPMTVSQTSTVAADPLLRVEGL